MTDYIFLAFSLYFVDDFSLKQSLSFCNLLEQFPQNPLQQYLFHFQIINDGTHLILLLS